MPKQQLEGKISGRKVCRMNLVCQVINNKSFLPFIFACETVFDTNLRKVLKNLLEKNAASFISMFLLVAVPVLFSSVLAVYLYQYQHVLQQLSPAQMLLYFAVVSFMMAFALTPTTFVALVTGFYLGWVAFPGVVLAYGLAALIGYTVARLIDHGKLMGFLNRFEKTMYVMQELREQSWSLIFLARISPVLPFAFMTFVLSVMRVEKRRFLVASMLGMLPRTLFFFWVGTQANDIMALLRDPNAGTWGQLLMVALIIFSIGGLYVLMNKAIKKALQKTSKKS